MIKCAKIIVHDITEILLKKVALNTIYSYIYEIQINVPLLLTSNLHLAEMFFGWYSIKCQSEIQDGCHSRIKF
jgi:hypothetical protein